MSIEALYKNKDNNIAFIAQKDLGSSNPIENFTIGGSTKVCNKDVKVKIDKDLNLAASVRYKHNDHYTFVFGLGIPVANLGKAESKNGFLPFDFGYLTEYNV